MQDDEEKNYKRCPNCNSSDEIFGFLSTDFRGDGKCKYCDGKGEITDELRATVGAMIGKIMTLGIDDGEYPATETCSKCYGSGQCQICGGTGRVKRKRFDSGYQEEDDNENGEEDTEDEDLEENDDDVEEDDDNDEVEEDEGYYSYTKNSCENYNDENNTLIIPQSSPSVSNYQADTSSTLPNQLSIETQQRIDTEKHSKQQEQVRKIYSQELEGKAIGAGILIGLIFAIISFVIFIPIAFLVEIWLAIQKTPKGEEMTIKNTLLMIMIGGGAIIGFIQGYSGTKNP